MKILALYHTYITNLAFTLTRLSPLHHYIELLTVFEHDGMYTIL